MMLSLFVAALALQTPKPAPTPAPAPAPAAKPDAKPAAEAKPDKGGEERFLADFDAAATIAKKEHKDLLVDFTGSDWCPWCVKLHKEVFDFDSFLDGAEKSFVLVALDFEGNGMAKKSDPNPKRNDELKTKYAIQGFPTVLLMTPDGEVFAKTGYAPGGPEKYLEDVNEKATSGKKAMVEIAELEKKYAAAKGADQEKLIGEALAKLGGLEDDSPFAARYSKIVGGAFTLDADNKKGLKQKAVDALLKAGQTSPEMIAAAISLDPKNEKGLFEQLTEAVMNSIASKEQIAPALKVLDDFLAVSTFKDPGTTKGMLANAAFLSKKHLEDVARAKGYATKLKALGLDGPDDAQLKKLVEDVLSG
jgi:thioredoxin-related protein